MKSPMDCCLSISFKVRVLTTIMKGKKHKYVLLPITTGVCSFKMKGNEYLGNADTSYGLPVTQESDDTW